MLDYKRIEPVINMLAMTLDTHDKRQLFVRMFIPDMLGQVNLEGTPNNTCRSLFSEAIKRGDNTKLAEGLKKLFPAASFDYVNDLKY